MVVSVDQKNTGKPSMPITFLALGGGGILFFFLGGGEGGSGSFIFVGVENF